MRCRGEVAILTFSCDGCGEAGEASALTTVGVLESLAYCRACLTAWQQAEAEADALLATHAQACESALRAHWESVCPARLRKRPDA